MEGGGVVEAGRKERCHQRVLMTCWWLWRPAFAGVNPALACLREEEGGGRWWGGRSRQEVQEKSHQRVLTTRWWLWRLAFAGGK